MALRIAILLILPAGFMDNYLNDTAVLGIHTVPFCYRGSRYKLEDCVCLFLKGVAATAVCLDGEPHRVLIPLQCFPITAVGVGTL